MRGVSRQPRSTTRRGFTLLELEVAIVLLAFGLTTLASLVTTQSRVVRRLRGDFKPGATICLTRSNDPWAQKIGTSARITTAPITLPAVPTVTPWNTVTIITTQANLNAETVTVNADATEIP